jgi:hypothetical protein
MLTFKRKVLTGALLLAGLGFGTIGCTDKNDAGKLPPTSDGGGSDAKADGTTGTGGSDGSAATDGGTGGADGGGTGGAGGSAADASAG